MLDFLNQQIKYIDEMDPVAFIHNFGLKNAPESVVIETRRVFLDNLGALLASTQTDASRIIFNYAVKVYPGTMKLFLDGRGVTSVGAVLAHATSCDALDIHDTHLTSRGHPGAAIIPAALSLIHDHPRISGRGFVEMIIIAYEISLRAGAVLTEAPEFHTSGAWNCIGAAAMYCRINKLTYEQTRHALGIAEYYGPRSQMMRCIDFPTMVKDGSGWGAFTGYSAAMMAELGFTGAPAILVETKLNTKTAKSELADRLWRTLGEKWEIEDIDYKSHALCAWSQTAVHGARKLRDKYKLNNRFEEISSIHVESFAEASLMTQHAEPKTTEEAQYSLPFAIGAALIYGRVAGRETSGDALRNESILRLSRLVKVVEVEDLSKLRPRIYSRVTITLKNGDTFKAPATAPEGFEEAPSNDELEKKFREILHGIIDESLIDYIVGFSQTLESQPGGALHALLTRMGMAFRK